MIGLDTNVLVRYLVEDGLPLIFLPSYIEQSIASWLFGLSHLPPLQVAPSMIYLPLSFFFSRPYVDVESLQVGLGLQVPFATFS